MVGRGEFTIASAVTADIAVSKIHRMVAAAGENVIKCSHEPQNEAERKIRRRKRREQGRTWEDT